MLIELSFQSSYWFLNCIYKMPNKVQGWIYMASTLQIQKQIPGHKASRSQVSQSRPKLPYNIPAAYIFFFIFPFFSLFFPVNMKAKKNLLRSQNWAKSICAEGDWHCRLLNVRRFPRGECFVEIFLALGSSKRQEQLLIVVKLLIARTSVSKAKSSKY